MNKLYHVATNNVKDKDQCNYAIECEPKCYHKFSLSSGTKDTLTVVTASLRVGKKHRETIIYGITCLWDSGSTNIMIKRRHAKPYKRNMRYNKVDLVTAIGPYCTPHYVKVPFSRQMFLTSI